MIDLLTPLELPGLTIPNRIFAAPVDGVFDQPFRVILKRVGNVGLTSSELVSAAGLRWKSKVADRKIMRHESERPFAVQLCDHDPALLVRAAVRLQEHGACDLVDLNLGCPARRTVSSRSGAALLLHPQDVKVIAREMRKVLKIPFTAKMRIGWDASQLNGVEIAKILEGEGVDLITVHGRTRAQAYSGTADWNFIGLIKQAVGIPVIANGDIVSFASAREALRVSGADGVMIARACFGDPWALKRIHDGDDGFRPNDEEKLALILDHLQLHVEFFADEKFSVPAFRKHLLWYVKGLPGAKAFRDTAVRLQTATEVADYLKVYLTTHFDSAK